MTSGRQKTFDRDDLVLAYFAARRWEGAHPDLRDYYRPRYQALAAAFDANLESRPKDPGSAWLYELFEATSKAYEAIVSPFSGWLEAPPAVIALYQRYGQRLEQHERDLQALHLKLLGELVGEIWGVSSSQTVGPNDLRLHGFDPELAAPDPDDYW